MTLPTPESLLPGIASIEQALAILEAQFAARTSSAASADAAIKVTANGMVELVSVEIAPAQLALAPGALAARVLPVAAQALSQVNADSAALAAAPARGYGLPGLVTPDQPPPPDFGFDRVVGGIQALRPAVLQAVRAARFVATDGLATAEVDGALELRALRFEGPLPDEPSTLELATVGAVNAALARAKGLFDQVTSNVGDEAANPRPPLPDVRPRALLVVENAASLRPSDERLKARLAALGFQVDVGKAPATVAADASGRGLVVISESVNPSDVGTKFTNAAVPVLVCDPVQFRDLKMTGGTWGTDKGDATGQTKLQITGGHPLAAGLSGQVTVTSTASKFVWGVPSAAARKVAAIVGSTTRWGIFAYDTGEAMVGLNAPSRRVGFFTGQDTPAALTDEGWRLFDAAVRWATAAKGLLTVKSPGALTEGDLALRRRLEERHGLEVLLRAEGDGMTSDLADMRVHVISESVSSTNVAARYLSSPAPTVVCEPNLYDDMKLTGGVLNTDFGELEPHTELEVLPGHRLSAGLSGSVTVVTSGQKFGWGKPGPEAIRVASIAGRADAFGIFAYEAGANMVGTRASAPRVGFFSEGNAPAAFTPDGAALFDAAVAWARAPRALLVVKQAAPLRADDEAIRMRLEQSFGFVVNVRLASDVLEAHTSGHHLVVISESIASSDLGGKLTAAAVPLVCLEPSVFDDLKMTGATSNTDFGAVIDQTELEMVKVDHPLAAGLATGRVAVVNTPSRFVWGLPSSGAVKIARLVGKPSAWGLFGYETGVTMVGRAAPARRVGCFVGEQTALQLNQTGQRLLDAAVTWAAGRAALQAGGPRIEDVVRGGTPQPGSGMPVPPALGSWKTGVAYKVGDQVRHQGLDYRCRQAHTSQVGWEPPNVYALWERINAGGAWTVQVLYKAGDQVTFGGRSYRCIQGHQSQPDWEPALVPALWQPVDG
jgi:DNA-binding protein YbaB